MTPEQFEDIKRRAEAAGREQGEAATRIQEFAEASLMLRADLTLLVTEVEQNERDIERLIQQCVYFAGQLDAARALAQAVQRWDDAGGDKAVEASRLLHNAYVDWHRARGSM